MKKLLLTLLVLSSSFLAFSQGTWTSRDTLPNDSAMFQGISGFSIGKYGYAGLGEYGLGSKYFTSLWQFNPATNSWTQKANFPGSARTYAVGFAIGGKGYVGTGANELSDFRKDFYAYDTATNVWARIADFGGKARSCASGFAANGK